MSFSSLLREFQARKSIRYTPSDAALVSQYLAIPIAWELEVSRGGGCGDQYARLFGQQDYPALHRHFEELVTLNPPLSESERDRIVKLVVLNNEVQSLIERQQSQKQQTPGSYFVSVPHWLDETVDPGTGKSMMTLLSTADPDLFNEGYHVVLRFL